MDAFHGEDAEGHPDKDEGDELCPVERFIKDEDAEQEGHGRRDVLHDTHGGVGNAPNPGPKAHERGEGHNATGGNSKLSRWGFLAKSEGALTL